MALDLSVEISSVFYSLFSNIALFLEKNVMLKRKGGSPRKPFKVWLSSPTSLEETATAVMGKGPFESTC